MSANPNFASTVKVGAVTISTADASRTAPAAAGTVLSGGSSGTRVSRVNVLGLGATTPGMVRLFLHDGTNYHLAAEIPISAVTPSGTQAGFAAALTEAANSDVMPLFVPSGWTLRASTQNAESFKVLAQGGDF